MLADIDAGLSVENVAKKHGIGCTSIRRWIRKATAAVTAEEMRVKSMSIDEKLTFLLDRYVLMQYGNSVDPHSVAKAAQIVVAELRQLGAIKPKAAVSNPNAIDFGKLTPNEANALAMLLRKMAGADSVNFSDFDGGQAADSGQGEA